MKLQDFGSRFHRQQALKEAKRTMKTPTSPPALTIVEPRYAQTQDQIRAFAEQMQKTATATFAEQMQKTATATTTLNGAAFAAALQKLGTVMPTFAPNGVASMAWSPESDFPIGRVRLLGGALLWARRLENRTSRYAEYTVTVSHDDHTGTWAAERAFGPIGETQNIQVIKVDADPMTVLNAARDTVRGKTRRDYVEVAAFENMELTAETALHTNEWVVTDDPILDPMQGREQQLEEATAPPPPSAPRSCICSQVAAELGQTLTAEPESGGPELAPLLSDARFGLMRFDSRDPGARWVIAVFADCAPGYAHVRAYPIGPALDDDNTPRSLRRNVTQFVEDVVQSQMRSVFASQQAGEADFVLVVEEKLVDLVIIDALRWNGEDISGQPLSERLGALSADAASSLIFGDKLQMCGLVTGRLREEYLANGDMYRYELVDLSAPAPTPSWRLPILD